MDPSSSSLDSLNQAASTRSSSAQDVSAHASTTIASPEQVASHRTPNAPSELVAPQRTTSAQSEQAAPERAMSSPAGNDATDIVAIEVDGDDSSLSSASPEVVRLPRWDDLGRSYNLNWKLLHKFTPSFGFKGTGTKPRSSSFSSLLQNGSYQPGRAYHSTHEKLTVTTHRCHKAMSQVAQMRITSAPCDDGPSDEDVIVVNSDHSLLTASSCVKLTSARTQCSLRAASYMYAVHIAVDQHALLEAWTRGASCCNGIVHWRTAHPRVWRTCQACDELLERTRTSTACPDHLAAWAHSTSCCTLTL